MNKWWLMVIKLENKNLKPVLLRGIGEINFGKQYRQGNRVYDSDEISMTLLSQPLGNTGGYSYLYLVSKNDKDKNEK